MQMSDRIGMRIKLQDVHTLMAVVQAGSMGKAARHLNTAQPNISKSIADLEHALGVRLLDRHRQGIAPTDYGRALIEGGAAVFDELRQAVRKIEFLADPTIGEVRVGCSPVLAASLGSAVVDRLSRRYPRMEFHLVTGNVEALHQGLSERDVDLLIAWKSEPVADARLDFEFLFDDPWVVAAGAQNPWTRKRRLTLAELVNEPWVVQISHPGSGAASMTTSTTREAFSASGLDYPRTTVVADSPFVRMTLLAAGRFITICPASTLTFSTWLRELKALPVVLPVRRLPCRIITLKNRTLSPAARLFIDMIREIAKSLAKGK